MRIVKLRFQEEFQSLRSGISGRELTPEWAKSVYATQEKIYQVGTWAVLCVGEEMAGPLLPELFAPVPLPWASAPPPPTQPGSTPENVPVPPPSGVAVPKRAQGLNPEKVDRLTGQALQHYLITPEEEADFRGFLVRIWGPAREASGSYPYPRLEEDWKAHRQAALLKEAERRAEEERRAAEERARRRQEMESAILAEYEREWAQLTELEERGWREKEAAERQQKEQEEEERQRQAAQWTKAKQLADEMLMKVGTVLPGEEAALILQLDEAIQQVQQFPDLRKQMGLQKARLKMVLDAAHQEKKEEQGDEILRNSASPVEIARALLSSPRFEGIRTSKTGIERFLQKVAGDETPATADSIRRYAQKENTSIGISGEAFRFYESVIRIVDLLPKKGQAGLEEVPSPEFGETVGGYLERLVDEVLYNNLPAGQRMDAIELLLVGGISLVYRFRAGFAPVLPLSVKGELKKQGILNRSAVGNIRLASTGWMTGDGKSTFLVTLEVQQGAGLEEGVRHLLVVGPQELLAAHIKSVVNGWRSPLKVTVVNRADDVEETIQSAEGINQPVDAILVVNPQGNDLDAVGRSYLPTAMLLSRSVEGIYRKKIQKLGVVHSAIDGLEDAAALSAGVRPLLGELQDTVAASLQLEELARRAAEIWRGGGPSQPSPIRLSPGDRPVLVKDTDRLLAGTFLEWLASHPRRNPVDLFDDVTQRLTDQALQKAAGAARNSGQPIPRPAGLRIVAAEKGERKRLTMDLQRVRDFWEPFAALERERLLDFLDRDAPFIREVVQKGKPIALLVDRALTNVTETQLRDIYSRLVHLRQYPAVELRFLSDEEVARYQGLNFQVIRLVGELPEGILPADTVYVQRPDPQEPVRVEQLPLILTGALARWQREQGRKGLPFIVFDASVYLEMDLRSLTFGEIWQLLEARYAA
ncbi:MAG: hypothetical protein HY211_01735 [Candidatus Omnitrophica bacterium]|nr:hypothetical protein [Candidatus Omnitrophota bacterium]